MLGVGVLHGRRQRSCVLWDEADDRQGRRAHMSRLRGVIRADVAKSFGANAGHCRPLLWMMEEVLSGGEDVG